MQLATALSIHSLKEIASANFHNLVKAVVDIESGQVMIDGEMHADLEAALIELGSQQKNLWGINLHPDLGPTEDCIEFDSMINVRPNQNNPSRDVLDPQTRAKITNIIVGMLTD